MLRLARYPQPGSPGDGGAAAVLLWRARRALGRGRAVVRLLLAASAAVAIVASWPRQVDAPIPLPSSPLAVAAGRGGRLDAASADGRVWSLDAGGRRPVGAVAGLPLALAADPRSGRVYVGTADTVAALGAPGAAWRVALPHEQELVALAMDAAIGQLYVATLAFGANHATGRLLALDARTGSLVAGVPVGTGPPGLAVDPHSHRIYVADAADGDVVALTGDPLAVRATIRVGGAPDRLAVDARAGRVYAADYATGALAVIDDATDAVIATVRLGIHPSDVAVDTGTGRVFVSDSGTGTIAVLNVDGTPPATLRAGAAPYGLVADPAGGRLYGIDLSDNSIWRIDDRRILAPVARLFASANVRESPAAGALMPTRSPGG